MARAGLELVRMRLLLLLRQPEILFWAFVFPILLTVVLGLAFRGGAEGPSRVVVVGPDAAEVGASLERLETPDLLVERVDATEGARRLAAGAADALLDATDGRLALRYDPARPGARAARLALADALQRGAGRTDPLELELVATRERGSRYVDWFVPGLLALSLMSTSVWGVGFAFVEARQQRLMKRFLVTPLRPALFLGAHVVARLALLVLEVAVLLAFARFVMGVPMRGSLVSLAGLVLVGALVFSGMGVLLGARARTPEGAAGLINVAMMPMGLASGIFFSYERFSEGLQTVVRALPLAAFADGMRAVMLEGRGLSSLGPELAIQLVWGVASFAVGLAIFRWR